MTVFRVNNKDTATMSNIYIYIYYIYIYIYIYNFEQIQWTDQVFLLMTLKKLFNCLINIDHLNDMRISTQLKAVNRRQQINTASTAEYRYPPWSMIINQICNTFEWIVTSPHLKCVTWYYETQFFGGIHIQILHLL